MFSFGWSALISLRDSALFCTAPSFFFFYSLIIIMQEFSVEGSFVPHSPPRTRDIWLCLQTIWVVTAGECYQHLEGRSHYRKSAKHCLCTGMSPTKSCLDQNANSSDLMTEISSPCAVERCCVEMSFFLCEWDSDTKIRQRWPATCVFIVNRLGLVT